MVKKRMKKAVFALFYLFSLLFSLCAASCPSTPPAQQAVKQETAKLDLSYVPSVPDAEGEYPLEPASGKTAFEFFRDEKLRAGLNIGNSLDAHAGGRANETGWGNPRINRAFIESVKAAGFDLVRVPVTWMGNIGPAPDCHIKEEYLQRVAEVVQTANKAGLKVIINLHHDGATSGPGQDVGWLSINKARASEAGYNEITHKFARVWRQIAIYFKNYGDWLIFEPFNELHDGNWGNGSVQGKQADIINDWNRIFTQIVRETGANNAARYLVVPGYSCNPRHTLANYFWLPPDSAPNRQIITFHYYDPYEFGIGGTRSNWGTDAEKSRIARDFAPFKEKYADKGFPVIIGECGAVRQLYPNDPEKEEKARQSRLAYLSCIFGTAKENGLTPIYWDNGGTTGSGEKFGLFNRREGGPNSEESAACIKAMTEAVK